MKNLKNLLVKHCFNQHISIDRICSLCSNSSLGCDTLFLCNRKERKVKGVGIKVFRNNNISLETNKIILNCHVIPSSHIVVNAGKLADEEKT